MNENIIMYDSQYDNLDNNNDAIVISDRLFELRDSLSVDIISHNIIENFTDLSYNRSINYITKIKEKYYEIKEDLDEEDINFLNTAIIDVTELTLLNLQKYFAISLGTDVMDSFLVNFDEYLDQIEALYEFFVVRQYSNIKDYFKNKIVKNKIVYIERYKQLLDDKTYDDLFFTQDKKKFKDISDVILMHFMPDIISDIKSEITSAFDFFKEIANLDLFEEYNNKINSMLINYGNELVILDDQLAIEKYLNILNNSEIFVSLQNDILSNILLDVELTEKKL